MDYKNKVIKYRMQKKKKQFTVHRRYNTEFQQNQHSRIINHQRPVNSITSVRRYQSQVGGQQLSQHKNYRKNVIQTESSPRRLLMYNKWYIKPQHRMKCGFVKQESLSNKINVDFAYNRLYEEESVKQTKPFEAIANQKLVFLERIPVHNVKLLETFKKSQQSKNKRVPKIIQLFLKKKKMTMNNCERQGTSKSMDNVFRIGDKSQGSVSTNKR